jgi:hypothetical protein
MIDGSAAKPAIPETRNHCQTKPTPTNKVQQHPTCINHNVILFNIGIIFIFAFTWNVQLVAEFRAYLHG